MVGLAARTKKNKPAAAAFGLTLTLGLTQINQKSSQNHTRARRSHIPAQPQRAASPAS